MTIATPLPCYRLILARHAISVPPWRVGVLTLPRLEVELAWWCGRGPPRRAFFEVERRSDSTGPEETPRARRPEGEGGSARTEQNGDMDSELSHTSVQ